MKLHTAEIKTSLSGHTQVFYSVIAECKEGLYLFDCGYEESFDAYREAFDRLRLNLSLLKAVIITHDDNDHLGGLGKFKDHIPGLMVVCGEAEEESVSGKIKSERLLQAEIMLNHLRGDIKKQGLQFIESLKKIRRFPVDKTLINGECFPDQIETVHTPGHTKGHLSFYCRPEKTMIAGDALVIENGEFNLANPQYTLHLEDAIRSVEIIREYKPEKVICYHGGVMTTNVDEKLKRLINTLRI